ncbi:MAG: hypothetical protein IIA87_05050 [Nanoarchaeota archaeon]|nr:hypothetical protein [Nanoarchaeota archaeon]
MPHKLNISESTGKSYKLETESDVLAGRSLGDTISGKEISPNLEGYELEITGASDLAGFPQKEDIEGSELRKLLLTKGWGMHAKTKGLRKRKTVRGKEISEKTVQINIKVLKIGNKPLKEIFPDQNKPKEVAKKTEEESSEEKQKQETPKEVPKEEKPQEEDAQKEKIITEEKKEEVKQETPKEEKQETKSEEKEEQNK